ncbi:MAG: TetR/AcrR family transcriptional regulator [Solirubrobacterales bacterium]
MTELHLIAGTTLAEPAREEEIASPLRLSPGHHGIPADLVRAHQRLRLLDAAAATLAEQGYGRLTAARVTELAGVSSRTFYQHFEDLWACLLAAYETEAGQLCEEIEASCADLVEQRGPIAEADRRGRGQTGIAAALGFLAGKPDVARLLSAEPPPQIAALAAARQDLVERLGEMLRSVLADPDGATPLPGLERRLIGAALAMVSTRAAGGDPQRLRDLEPELSELLLASL